MASPSAQPDFERFMLLGRQRELDQFEVVLKRRRPMLVLVVGETGMGKTNLLRAFRLRAAKKGWQTVPADDRSELFVIPTSTQQTFRDQLVEALDASSNESRAAITRAEADAELKTLLKQLRERSSYSPILLLIDGYRPADPFANWFTEAFIKGIKITEASLVVIVACVPEFQTRMRSVADEIIQMGPLDSEAVMREFEGFAKKVNPPINSKELQTYAAEASRKPALVGDLLRVLSLARVGDA